MIIYKQLEGNKCSPGERRKDLSVNCPLRAMNIDDIISHLEFHYTVGKGDYPSKHMINWYSTLDKQRICVNTQLKSSKKQLK